MSIIYKREKTNKEKKKKMKNKGKKERKKERKNKESKKYSLLEPNKAKIRVEAIREKT